MHLILTKRRHIAILCTVIDFLMIFFFPSLLLSGCRQNKAEYKPVSTTRIAANDGMTQVFIPAGEFLMGSSIVDIDVLIREHPEYSRDSFKDEMPQHKVYLDAYWIDKYEVTNSMFSKFVAETGYKTDAEKFGGGIVLDQGKREWKMVKDADWHHPRGPTTDIIGLDDHPVVQVSHNDALAYCKWVGRRLLTEAEWEKAARGTDGRIYPWGNQPPAGNLLNFADRNAYIASANLTEDDGYQYTAPVGSYPQGASTYGVMDMAGNVWEHVSDWYGNNYYSKSTYKNPRGPSSGINIIMRGGSMSRPDRFFRTTSRYKYIIGNRSIGLGFRCALTPLKSRDLGFDLLPPVSKDAERSVFIKDTVVTNFDAVHLPVNRDIGEYLIFGNIPVETPGTNPVGLDVFLGRWEGYDLQPPVKKDWKYVLVIREINSKGGKAYLWAGTNLQYPVWIKEINFKVVVKDVPSIEWDYYEKGIKKTLSITCTNGGKSLLARQLIMGIDISVIPIKLDKGRSFYVYKDYAQYLAGKRIYPRWYRNKSLSYFNGQGYLLYLPEGYEDDPKRTWPLIIFLHGSGDRGDNLFLLAKASPFMMIREKGPLPFIIVAPLLAKTEFNLLFSDDYLKGVLDETLEDYRVDRSRIYVTGLSLGGEATYRFALIKPDTFAAIAPLSAYISFNQDMRKIRNLPVWAIHGENDTVVSVATGRKPVDALIQAGGNVRFSILPDHDHDVWTDTYLDPGFYDWLLKHRKP